MKLGPDKRTCFGESELVCMLETRFQFLFELTDSLFVYFLGKTVVLHSVILAGLCHYIFVACTVYTGPFISYFKAKVQIF